MPDTHFFNVNLAVKYGVENAVILSNLCYWVRHNAQNNTNFFEGRFWTYNTLAAFKKQFPYLSASQIRTALAGLKKAGAVVTGNFNKRPFDRTLWYSVSDEAMLVYDPPKAAETPPPEPEPQGGMPDTAPPAPEMPDGQAPPICENSQMHLRDLANAFAESRTPIPDINKYINADSSASPEPEKIPETPPAAEAEEAEEADAFSIQKLKEALAKTSPLLVFDKSFYPAALDALKKYGLDESYIPWLYEFCETKKPKDITAYYFKVFCEESVISRFAAARAPRAPPPREPCPVCGSSRAADEACPSCGFSGGARDVPQAKFLYAMPPDVRAAFDAERAAALASGGTLERRILLLKKIRQKYGVPD